jgi:competence protein CoiA
MLIAEIEGNRIDAFTAQLGPTYHCPHCRGEVVLKKGAEVMAWSPNDNHIAFELQHTAIGREEIEARASSYARAGIAQIWIPFINASVWKDGYPRSGGWFIERYSPRDFERWVHGFAQGNGMWMYYDPNDKAFWLGRLAGHQTYVEESTWYSEGGEENYSAGFWKYSKRYKELTLEGPFKAEDLRIKVTKRKACYKSGHRWPAGHIANFVPANAVKTAKTPAEKE